MGLIKLVDPFASDYYSVKSRDASRYNSVENEKKRKEVIGILRNQGFRVFTKKGESYTKCVKAGFENQPFFVSKSGNVRVGAKDGILIKYDNFLMQHS